MEKIKVLRRGKELTAKNSYYEIEYNGRTHRVPLFQFQEDMPVPDEIWCTVKNGRPLQANKNLFDHFYKDLSIHYIFRIKSKRESPLNYYELEDPRVGDALVHHTLYFAASSRTLNAGQYIKCAINEIKDDKLRLTLVDENPSLIPFNSFDQIFGTAGNESLRLWISRVVERDYMKPVSGLYAEGDGRWILLFSTMLERVILEELERDTLGRDELLKDFCRGWLDAVEHSTFIRDMSEEESAQYNLHLTRSIEICEDILDAAQAPDKEEVVRTCISSLNPQFYQYRIEKRLRFVAYTFSMREDLMRLHMPDFLAQLRLMGEKRCCSDSLAGIISAILKTHVDRATRQIEQALSINAHDTLTIKQSVLALCYLSRILGNRHSDTEALYVSKLFQLLSLLNTSDDDKKKLLKNAYNALFATSSSISTYSWDDFDNIVRNQIVRFTTALVNVDTQRRLTFDDGNTQAKFAHNAMSLAPLRTEPRELVHTKMMGDVDIALRYGKSISNIAKSEDILEVQNAWVGVNSSVFAQAPKPKEEVEDRVNDGDKVWIYITELITDSKARAKVLDYGDEGTIDMDKMFFYAHPQLTDNDFRGSDGSPLVFQATCHRAGDNVSFEMEDMKKELAIEHIQIENTTCCVLRKTVEHQYHGVTQDGFFVLINSPEQDLELQSFVTVYVTGKRSNGNGEGYYVEPAEGFDNRTVYTNYMRLMNLFGSETGDEATVLSMQQEDDEPENDVQQGDKVVGPAFVRTVADVLSKYSRLERETRERYAYLQVSSMLCRLVNDEDEKRMMSIRLKFTTYLYQFALNNAMLQTDAEEFAQQVKALPPTAELNERLNVINILTRYGKLSYQERVDKTLLSWLDYGQATPMEIELAKLVLATQMLSTLKNRELEDQLLSEICEVLNININKQQRNRVGVESQTLEFKTSLVIPPANRGHVDVEQQSDNIVRVVLSMMNTVGGELMIGVDDSGYPVGLRSDLNYFSENGLYDEAKSKDLFSNYFSCLMKERIGAEYASRLKFGFEMVEGYCIFRVVIPEIHDSNIDYVRIGATSQRK